MVHPQARRVCTHLQWVLVRGPGANMNVFAIESQLMSWQPLQNKTALAFRMLI